MLSPVVRAGPVREVDYSGQLPQLIIKVNYQGSLPELITLVNYPG